MDKIHKYPGYVQCFNIPATILAVILFYEYEVFDLSDEWHRFNLYLIIFTIMVLGLLIGFAKSYKFGDRSDETGELGNFKWHYRIGTYGIFQNNLLALLIFYNFQNSPLVSCKLFSFTNQNFNFQTTYFAFFVSNVTTAMFYFAFIWKMQPMCREMKCYDGWLHNSILYSSVGIVPFGVLGMSMYSGNYDRMLKIWLPAIYYLPAIALNIRTHSAVMRGEIELVEPIENIKPMVCVA